MRVPYKAKAILSTVGHLDGTYTHRFALDDGSIVETMTYHPYPFKDSAMTEQRDSLLKFWQELDDCVDQIRGEQNDVVLYEAEKVRATTYAEVLAYLMHRFYPDAQAVLRESMARWKARQAGELHVTPGLAEELWSPDTRFDGTPYSRSSEGSVRSGGTATATKGRKTTGNKIPDQAVDSWKTGIAQAMFTVDQCAKTYNMTPAEVKAQLGLD